MADSVLVEVGAGDARLSPAEVAEILAGLRTAQRARDDLRGVAPQSDPMERLAGLLRDAVRDLPVPEACTGYWDEFALIAHDGDTCPVHELGEDD